MINQEKLMWLSDFFHRLFIQYCEKNILLNWMILSKQHSIACESEKTSMKIKTLQPYAWRDSQNPSCVVLDC